MVIWIGNTIQGGRAGLIHFACRMCINAVTTHIEFTSYTCNIKRQGFTRNKIESQIFDLTNPGDGIITKYVVGYLTFKQWTEHSATRFL